MSRTVRWVELSVVFGVLPALLALHAGGLSLPVLFIAAWVCLALLWRDPTFQRDQLWRREQLWTWLRGPLALALGVGTLAALGLYLLEPGHLFDLPRSSPWLLVMLLCPVLSVVLMLLGGWLLVRTYLRTRSLLATAVEHAAYGCLLFTVGLGRWFVTGG